MTRKSVDLKKLWTLNMEVKSMKTNYFFITSAFFTALAITPSVGFAQTASVEPQDHNHQQISRASAESVSGTVMHGNFNKTGELLVADFKNSIKTIIDTQTNVMGTLEDLKTQFKNCDSKFGQSDMDSALYSECVIDAAQQERSAYKQVRAELRSLDKALDSYRQRLKGAVEEAKSFQGKEDKKLQADLTRIDGLTKQARDLIKEIEELDPESNLTAEQTSLIYDLVDDLEHSYFMSGIHRQGKQQLEMGLTTLASINAGIDGVTIAVKRGMKRADYRALEASEFIRVTRYYGLGQANQLEAGEILGMLQGLVPDINRAVSNASAYSGAMKNYGVTGGSPVVFSQKPQTVGEALAALKSMISKKEGGNE